jgi:hypothetical protein
MMPGPNLFPPCCTARKTSSEIKDLRPFLDRLSRATLSTGKFTGADLEFRLALTTLQFPNVLKRQWTALKALDVGRRSTTSRLIQWYHRRWILHLPAGPSVGAKATRVRLTRRETMLSPHEFATLLLVKDAPNQVDMEREELDALLERQLVELEKLASGLQQWRITESGDTALRAIKRFS